MTSTNSTSRRIGSAGSNHGGNGSSNGSHSGSVGRSANSSGSSLRTAARMQLMNLTPATSTTTSTNAVDISGYSHTGASSFPSGVSSSLSSSSSSSSQYQSRSLSAATTAVTAAAAAGEQMLRSSSSLSPLPPSPFGGSFQNFRHHRHQNHMTNGAYGNDMTSTPTRPLLRQLQPSLSASGGGSGTSNYYSIANNTTVAVPAIPISSYGITPAIIPSSSYAYQYPINHNNGASMHGVDGTKASPVVPMSTTYMPLPPYMHAPLSADDLVKHNARVARASVRREQRRQRRALPRHTFRSPLAAKPDRVHKMYIRRPGVLPVISMHLAVLHIQKLYRGHRARQRVAQLRALSLPQPITNTSITNNDGDDTKINDDSKDEKRLGATTDTLAPVAMAVPRVRARRPPLYARYFAETGMTHVASGDHDRVTPQYQHWAARRIQNHWRYWKRRRHATYQRYSVYTAAATTIQRAWRKYADVLHHTRELPQRIDGAARMIQRAWRSWTDKRIFQYFRKLIINRQHSDPVMLIKSLNPMEAQLVDGASGLYVRFRLGGIMFPPVIYYKIFTRTAITDIGSFAPRDYSRSRKVVQGDTKGLSHNHAGTRSGPTFDSNDQTHWYKRWENNGWRPISEKLLWEQDHVVTSTHDKRIDYHHNRLVRQVDLLKKRKRKKLLWVKKMYAIGAANANTSNTNTNSNSNGVNGVDGKTAAASTNDTLHDEKSSSLFKSIGDHDDDDESSAALREEVLRRLAAIDHNTDEVFNQNWEDEADDLLKWTKGLDFEDYNSTWFETATSRPADRSYREAFPAM